MGDGLTRTVGRALGAALLGALLGAAWLTFFYVSAPEIGSELDRELPDPVTGFHGPEIDPDTGLTFAWTTEAVRLELHGIDRRVDWLFSMRFRGGRPDPEANPSFSIEIDDREVLRRQTGLEYEEIEAVVPARPEVWRGTRIRVRLSSTFVPGDDDQRVLGMQVDRWRLEPAGMVLPPRGAYAAAVIGSAVLAAAVALLGVTPGSAVGAAVLFSAAMSALLARGLGPYSTYPATTIVAALLLGIAMAIGARIAEARHGQPLRNTARFAFAFSTGAVLLVLLLLFHPDMPTRGAEHHVEQLGRLLSGRLGEPDGLTAAPGLYLAAAPFAAFVSPEPGHLQLLRAVTICALGIAGLLLYLAVLRAWCDRLAAAVAVAGFQLVPLQLRLAGTGELPTLFAHALAVGLLVAISAGGRSPNQWRFVLVVLGLLVAVVLTSPIAAAAVFLAVAVTAGVFARLGTGATRSAAAPLGVAAAGAFLIGLLLYVVLPFEPLHGVAAAQGRWPWEYGWPLVLLGGVGAWRLWTDGARDRLALALAGLTIAAAAVTIVAITAMPGASPSAAVVPAIAALAGRGAAEGWGHSGWPRAITGALLGWVAWSGIWTWWVLLR